MNLYGNYKSRLGYQTGENQIDSYGVDHSGFSTRDELEYQIARQELEKQITENLNRQGIEPENYPQLGNNFWGNNPENNYGFGSSNIHDNIENRENQTQNNSWGSNNTQWGVNNTQSDNINSGYEQSNTKPQAHIIFGTSSQDAIETTDMALGYEPVGDVMEKTTLNRFENIKRELQQDALDVAYGASRAINGMTAGGLDYLGDKLGFDSRMKSYLDSLPESERMQRGLWRMYWSLEAQLYLWGLL